MLLCICVHLICIPILQTQNLDIKTKTSRGKPPTSPHAVTSHGLEERHNATWHLVFIALRTCMSVSGRRYARSSIYPDFEDRATPCTLRSSCTAAHCPNMDARWRVDANHDFVLGDAADCLDARRPVFPYNQLVCVTSVL